MLVARYELLFCKLCVGGGGGKGKNKALSPAWSFTMALFWQRLENSWKSKAWGSVTMRDAGFRIWGHPLFHRTAPWNMTKAPLRSEMNYWYDEHFKIVCYRIPRNVISLIHIWTYVTLCMGSFSPGVSNIRPKDQMWSTEDLYQALGSPSISCSHLLSWIEVSLLKGQPAW